MREPTSVCRWPGLQRNHGEAKEIAPEERNTVPPGMLILRALKRKTNEHYFRTFQEKAGGVHNFSHGL